MFASLLLLVATALAADTDEDGIEDADEVAAGTEPLAYDTDGDSLSDGEEWGRDTDADGTIDPLDGDDDGDGLPTGLEATNGLSGFPVEEACDGGVDDGV